MSKDNLISLDMRMTGKVIKNMITKRGFSIREIQQKLNLSCPQPVYRWMSGQTMPSLDNLYMLSSILGMHMEDLLMTRNDEMWILHEAGNADFGGRVKSYFRAVNANG
ncbi:MAG: helix-turn-helix domain-containing protein [Lachnospiraceae bacterium]|nr:helix-turn-helix domain-containing protein [Lachnospiraceae bacterium]